MRLCNNSAFSSTALLLALIVLPGQQMTEKIVLSEFQVWADARGPEVFEALNRQFLDVGRSHLFGLYPEYDNFVWELPRMKFWVDEAVELGAFNVFCIGDDTMTALGRLFDGNGVNPKLSDVYFKTVEYAHEKGLMVAVEPAGLPRVRDKEHFVPWLKEWIGRDVPKSKRADIIKLSIEWFGAYNLMNAKEVEAFMLACEEVNPDVLVYIDSIGGIWRVPQAFHRWLLSRFPGTILSHYLNTEQVGAFREIGARNLMVQINPCETWETGGQYYIYFDKTVASLQDAVDKDVRFLSLAGVNWGYDRRLFDLFLEVVRPHLDLAKTVEEIRESIVPDEIKQPATYSDVEAWITEERLKIERERGDLPIPVNKAGRPAFFGESSEGTVIQRLAAIGDGEIGARFTGAHTVPYMRDPVTATMGVDFGEERTITNMHVVPCLSPTENVYLATDFRLEYRNNDKWVTLSGGVFKGNRKRDITINFAPVKADAIRIVIERALDDGQSNYRVCVLELSAS